MRRTLILAAVAALCAAGPASAADADPPPPPRTPNLLVFGLGPVYWPGVHDLDPSGSPYASELGRFHTWGFGLEFAYQRRVARPGGVDLLLGGDIGLFSNESSAEFDAYIYPFGGTVDGQLYSRGLFLTPSIRFVPGGTQHWRFSFGAGAGFYMVDFTELLDGFFEANELFSESSFGGYLSVGADRRLSQDRPRWRLRLETKVHFVDFGSADSYAPGAGDLTGPIDTLLIGFVWDR